MSQHASARPKPFLITILQCSRYLIASWVLSTGALHAQPMTMHVNGSAPGAALLKACDLNNDGSVTLAELKQVAAAFFNFWDANADASLTAAELAAGLKQLFPAPPGAEMHIATGAGIAYTTPEAQLVKHVFLAADTNKDGWLTQQEVADFLDQHFSHWDQDASGSLNAQELDAALLELMRPD